MEMETYVCPVCRGKQESVICWVTSSVAYEFDIRTGRGEEVNRRGNTEGWVCPECNGDLPNKLIEELCISLEQREVSMEERR